MNCSTQEDLLNLTSCNYCSQNISLEQNYIKCVSCACIMHTECKRGHSRFRRSNYCVSCITTGDITKYNPFFEIFEEHTENHDKNFTVGV